MTEPTFRLAPLLLGPGAPPQPCPCCRSEDATHALVFEGVRGRFQLKVMGRACARALVRAGLKADIWDESGVAA